MDSNQLKELIRKREIPKFMIFIDNNPYNMSLYKNQIVKIINLPVLYHTDIQDAIYEASSFLAEDSIYYIRIDSTDKILKKSELFSDALSTLKKIGQYTLVILNDKGKVPKAFLGDTVVFDKYDYNSLYAFGKQVCELNKIPLSNNKLQELIDKSDCDLGVASNTLMQLSTLNKAGGDIESFEFCDYRKGNIFVLCDKILSKDNSAWEYSQLVSNETMMVAFNLWKKARERLKSTNSIYYANIICECEYIFNGITTGDIKDEYALKYLIAKIFKENN